MIQEFVKNVTAFIPIGLPLIGIVFSTALLLILFVVTVKSLIQQDLSSMFRENSSNKLSMTRFWMNVAYFCATLAFLAINLRAVNDEKIADLPMLWLIYLGTVASNSVANKWISAKYLDSSGGNSFRNSTSAFVPRNRFEKQKADVDSPD